MISQTREEIAGALLGAYASREPIDPLTATSAGLGSVTARFTDGEAR